MTKSSAYPPLDVLVDLACRDGVDIRPTLLRVLTDLYVQKPTHSADEEIQYVELALGLIGSVDAPTRAAVAARLSAYPAAPAAVLAKLAGPTAQPSSPAPSQNEAKPIPRNDLVELFFAASAEERRLILTNLDVVAEPAPRLPPPAASEVIRRLENAALQHNPGEFSRMLERALGVNRQLAERMVTIWRQSNARPQAMHAPLHWDDERRDARSLATPARYRSDRGRIVQPSRVKPGTR